MKLRVVLNGLVVAALTFAGVMAVLMLPTPIASPARWAGQYFEGSTVLVMSFLYNVLVWGVIGALIAAMMQVLQPRIFVLYGLISAVTFIVTMQSWHLVLEWNSYAVLREVVFVLTIPMLYFMFARLASRRRGNAPETTNIND